MSEEVYAQTKSRIRGVFEACDWSDDVGRAFEDSLMPHMFQELDRLTVVETEIDELMCRIEDEFPEEAHRTKVYSLTRSRRR